MDVVSNWVEIARQFAAALDSCNYGKAAEFLSERCLYERPRNTALVGRQSICSSYRESDVRAKYEFDIVKYRSEATAEASGGVRLVFYDDLALGDATHTFRCSQIVYFDENQKIVRIVLEEIPGERERLDSFRASHPRK